MGIAPPVNQSHLHCHYNGTNENAGATNIISMECGCIGERPLARFGRTHPHTLLLLTVATNIIIASNQNLLNQKPKLLTKTGKGMRIVPIPMID
jgi:hypothetical protein